MEQTPSLREIVPSLIRTYTPTAVGALLAWLTTLGIEVDGTAGAGLITGLTAVFIALYYTLARLIEQRLPKAGKVMLLSGKQPVSIKAENIVQLTAAKNAIVKNAEVL